MIHELTAASKLGINEHTFFGPLHWTQRSRVINISDFRRSWGRPLSDRKLDLVVLSFQIQILGHGCK